MESTTRASAESGRASVIQPELRDSLRLDADQRAHHDPPAQYDADNGSNNFDAPPPRPRSALRAGAKVAAVAAILAALFVAGRPLWNYLQSYESTDDAEIDGHIAPVASRIDGTIARVYVDNTQRVNAGQLLAEIDPRDQLVAVENARANLAQTQQAVKAAQQNYRFGLSNLAGADATNAKAQLDVERYRELLNLQVIARETYDQIISVGKVDAAAVNSDRAAVAAAQTMTGQAEAAVQGAQAALDQALLNLSYTKIIAPFNGVIGKRSVETGQRVQPGEQLMAVVSLDDVWVTANFKETQIRRMHAGERATIYVDALGRDYEGYVEGMAGASGEMYSLIPPENATGNYVKVVQRLPVRLRFKRGQDAAHDLRPGLSVEPTVWLR
jgi:membrane fusion protein, multidrug efflux system